MAVLLLLLAVTAISSSVQGAGITPEQVHISATGVVECIDLGIDCRRASRADVHT